MLITYNGVSLPYSDCSEFTEEAVYDDLSKTDKMCSRYTITSTFVIHTAYALLIDPTLANELPDGASPVDIMLRLSERMLTPRLALSVKFAGKEIIPNPTAGLGTVDVMNGPFPQYFRYRMMTSESFVVEYSIIAHYVQKYNSLSERTFKGGVFLYNRWEESVSIDDCLYTKRTRKGEFKIRSDNDKGFTADQLRPKLAVLSVPHGFIRESSNYSITADGLGINYTVVDMEIYRFPPPPAHKAEGHYAERGSGFGCPIRRAECQLKLWGKADVGQANLVQRATQIIAVKLKLVGANPIPPPPENKQADARVNNIIQLFKELITAGRAKAELQEVQVRVNLPESKAQGILERWDVVVDSYKNTVECYAVARFIGTRRARASIADLRKGVTITPFSEAGGGTQPPYTDRGTAGILLEAAAYYDNREDIELGPGGERTGSIDTEVGPGRLQLDTKNALQPGQAGKKKEL